MLASSTLALAQADPHGHDAGNGAASPPALSSGSSNAGAGNMGGGMTGGGMMNGGMMNGGMMNGGMMNGGMMGQGASGDVDRQFAERMKMHHEGAVQMARTELGKV